MYEWFIVTDTGLYDSVAYSNEQDAWDVVRANNLDADVLLRETCEENGLL